MQDNSHAEHRERKSVKAYFSTQDDQHGLHQAERVQKRRNPEPENT
jgi:hypothetical protein